MTTTNNEKLSVILSVHNQAENLEHNLPLYLQLECDEPYRVIVVDEASTDETPDVLKRMRAEYSHLYTTFMPQYSYSPLRHRLATNIGLKAARGEWVVLIDISRPPCSATMLKDMLHQATDAGCMAATAYYHLKSNSIRFVCWENIDELAPLLRKTERRNAHRSHSRWMNIRRGSYDALIIRRNCANQALPFIYQDIRGAQLAALRLKIFLDSFTY
jgi:hypothetical protein